MHDKKLDQIKNRLRRGGHIITTQRRMIIEDILSCGSHFDIESLAARMQRRDRHTARATVYRTVKILSDAGIVKREMLGERHSHYEVVERDHGHFICTSCGGIVELSCGTLQHFLAAESKQHHFAIERHSIELFGTCGKCREKGRNRNGNPVTTREQV